MKQILITIAAVLLVLLVGFGLATCFYVVDRREHAVVLRLGKYTGSPVTEQGLHFKLPFGIDKHTPVEVATPHKVVLVEPISDLQWSASYRISDAYNYLFKVQNGFESFLAMNEGVMREVVRGRKINEEPNEIGQMEQEIKSKLQSLANKRELGVKFNRVVIEYKR